MNLLLDTHVFLWWSEDNRRLKSQVKRQIVDADLVVVSVVSAWETVIKVALGKMRLDVPFEKAVEINHFSKLRVEFRHAAAVAALAPHHGDPFDRMLIAQALTEGLTIVTHDRHFSPYGVPVLWS